MPCGKSSAVQRYPMRWASRLLPHKEHCNVSISSSVHRCVDFSGCVRRFFRSAYRRGECQRSASCSAGVRNALHLSQSMRLAQVHAACWGLWMRQRICCLLACCTVGTRGKRCGCGAKRIGKLGPTLRNASRHLRLRRAPRADMRCHQGLPACSVLKEGRLDVELRHPQQLAQGRQNAAQQRQPDTVLTRAVANSAAPVR